MSTTSVTAGEIMDRVANLLNDPSKTDYTYAVQIPYLNLAIEEYSDHMAESNVPFANLSNRNWSDNPIIIPVGVSSIVPFDQSGVEQGTHPMYPIDLIEIQEIGERQQGSTGGYIRLPRKEFQDSGSPATNSLLYWVWERGIIRFNPNGANQPIEVQIKYIYQGITYAANENTIIVAIGARTFLAYRTAAFCALFIGENESRARVLEQEAERALERSMNISNKGKQQIMTRHRPFRASYKARGGW